MSKTRIWIKIFSKQYDYPSWHLPEKIPSGLLASASLRHKLYVALCGFLSN